MKNRNPALVSHVPLEKSDLRRLLHLAREDRSAYFRDNPEWAKLYADRVLGTALCQGAALHYLDPSAGINDFDVYTFYAANPRKTWYAKRIKRVDYGDPKFGVSEVTGAGFIGRRVDLMGRSLPVPPGTSLVPAIQRWLESAKSGTPKYLREKAVIVLEPIEQLGNVAWPPSAASRAA